MLSIQSFSEHVVHLVCEMRASGGSDRADTHASMILGITSTSKLLMNKLLMNKHTFSNAGVWW